QFALLAKLFPQVEDEAVERLRRGADGDRPPNLAVRELLAVDGGDKRPLDAGDQLGDGGDGGVERVDLELHVAGPDDDPPRRRLRLRRGRLTLVGLRACALVALVLLI